MALGLHCCTQALTACSKWGLLFIEMHELLIGVASLIVEHRFSCSIVCGIFQNQGSNPLVPSNGRWILHQWTTREVPHVLLWKKSSYQNISWSHDSVVCCVAYSVYLRASSRQCTWWSFILTWGDGFQVVHFTIMPHNSHQWVLTGASIWGQMILCCVVPCGIHGCSRWKALPLSFWQWWQHDKQKRRPLHVSKWQVPGDVEQPSGWAANSSIWYCFLLHV